jgi:hypothetical protein
MTMAFARSVFSLQPVFHSWSVAAKFILDGHACSHLFFPLIQVYDFVRISRHFISSLSLNSFAPFLLYVFDHTSYQRLWLGVQSLLDHSLLETNFDRW